jgi:hypothetical protein
VQFAPIYSIQGIKNDPKEKIDDEIINSNYISDGNFLIILTKKKSIQKSKNHQRRIFLDNYYQERCLV